ncbi:TetR/AcrR family transcriptional regulator [Stackebrandtia soli]|uniref:TetR/AcrR family transcriptional regulator n=1 Tax=Stackebrandtia soli TaxID=1892856 RepID=UPI0039E75854
MATAERLYAERGLTAVSNRQIGEAAGQGNNTAVSYHFGTKTDLIRAITREHGDRVENHRASMVAAAAGSADVRTWIACIVRPFTEHLNELGTPSWFARFTAQANTDPAFREIIAAESLSSRALVQAMDGLNACLPALPLEVRVERGDMAAHLLLHAVAERERALAEGAFTPRATWNDAASGLVDALAGLWTAPVGRTA